MIKIKTSTKNRIVLKILDKEIVAQITYPKHSRLKKRLKVLDKLKKELYEC